MSSSGKRKRRWIDKTDLKEDQCHPSSFKFTCPDEDIVLKVLEGFATF